MTWNPRSGALTGGDFTAGGSPSTLDDGLLHIASFNIKFAREIDQAIRVLQGDPHLSDADVLLLQEMDAPGVSRIAEALGFCWVYYPATMHPQSKRHFGNAILSRHPIREDHKVLLPHLGQFGKTLRIAVAATVEVEGLDIRIYSAHLATQVELGPERRRNQVRAIAADAALFNGPVVVGGDLNARSLGKVFVDAGFEWITEEVGNTTAFASLDHVLALGLSPAAADSVGKIVEAMGASDHLPIWVKLKLP